MPDAVIVSAVRTAIATARKGTLSRTSGEKLATHVVLEAARRSGIDPDRFDDVILAESLYGGGDLARYAAVAADMQSVPGQALNRHCAGGLTAVGSAAATIRAGMETAIIAGGVQSSSLAPRLTWPTTDEGLSESRMPATFPYTEDATDDVALSVGWNTAREAGLSREEMDAWALRSHQRALAAIDSGVFVDEIASMKVTRPDGTVVNFEVDEHPRRDTSLERLGSLKPLHPEIDGFSITAGNSSGVNDAAAALAIVSESFAAEQGLEPLAVVRSWTALGVDPGRTGMAAVEVIPRVLERAGIRVSDVALWEINEAFASVPMAACKSLGLDEDTVNIYGSGCSLGHPVSASGARMLTTLAHELHRRGTGIAVAAMCAGGGQAGAMVIEAC
ncbi:MAG: thiolase family protein [Rhodococcus sp. (in: high G+C Gram-positive bacteria)]|uniref:thiolase family protein n=1 Tax=Rhodococcus sp. TaxID=1831 RepID=UPI003BAE8D97